MYLTNTERAILVFLTASLLLGVSISYYKKTTNRATIKLIPADTELDDRHIETLLKNSKTVNINTADIPALTRLPGIGPALAEEIISHRNSRGLFQRVEDLSSVRGIGEKKLEAIKEYITIE